MISHNSINQHCLVIHDIIYIILYYIILYIYICYYIIISIHRNWIPSELMDVHLHCASYEKFTRKTMSFPRLGRRRRCCHGCCCCIVLGGHCKTSKLPTLSTSPFPGLNRPISWPMSWPSFFPLLEHKRESSRGNAVRSAQLSAASFRLWFYIEIIEKYWESFPLRQVAWVGQWHLHDVRHDDIPPHSTQKNTALLQFSGWLVWLVVPKIGLFFHMAIRNLSMQLTEMNLKSHDIPPAADE